MPDIDLVRGYGLAQDHGRRGFQFRRGLGGRGLSGDDAEAGVGPVLRHSRIAFPRRRAVGDGRVLQHGRQVGHVFRQVLFGYAGHGHGDVAHPGETAGHAPGGHEAQELDAGQRVVAVLHDEIVPGPAVNGRWIRLAGGRYRQVEGPQAETVRYLAQHLALEPRTAEDHGRVAQEKLELRFGVAHAHGARLEKVERDSLRKGQRLDEFGIVETAAYQVLLVEVPFRPGEVVVRVVDHGLHVARVTALEGERPHAGGLDFFAKRKELFPCGRRLPAVFFEEVLVVPHRVGRCHQGNAVGLTLVRVLGQGTGQERFAPGAVPLPVGLVEKLVQGQQVAVADERPVVQAGVGDLGEGAFQDAHPHLVVYAGIAVKVDHYALMLLFIGPGALEEELQPLAALEKRDFDANRALGLWLTRWLVLRMGDGRNGLERRARNNCGEQGDESA